jgi:hypothetical protein
VPKKPYEHLFICYSIPETLKDPRYPQFFNKDEGWGDLEDATKFTINETRQYSLPEGAYWLQLPPP